MSGEARNVVQTGSAESISVGATHDRRGVIALMVVAIALILAIVLVVVFTTSRNPVPESDNGRATSGAGGGRSGESPVAAVASYAAVGCRSGWVVANRGDDPIPYTSAKPPAGAVMSSGGEVKVTVQGLAGKAVVLQSMEVEVVRRSQPMTGIYLPLGCQGEVPPRKFVLNLDAPAPKIVPQPGTVTFPYKVNEAEPEQFVITPEVTAEDIEWRLHLKWTSAPDEGELVLGGSGQPFRTTATTAARKFCFDDRNRMWRPSC